MGNIFIPKKIKVGFQKRPENITGRISYITYYDNKGVLRKEKSWREWCDSTPSEEFDNDPQEGLCLNKSVQRYNWGHFSSNRSYISIFDPRGIEFEITPENLIGILTETDCLKRGLQGKFVYAWEGTNLVLLPCGSEEYRKAVEHTTRQEQSISAKNLKPGVSYTTKSGEEAIYIGKLPWYEIKYDYSSGNRAIKAVTGKSHIFCFPEHKNYSSYFERKADVRFLATENSPHPVSNFADLVVLWNKEVRSSPVDLFDIIPEPIDIGDLDKVNESGGNFVNFMEVVGDELHFNLVQKHTNRRDWKGTNLPDKYAISTRKILYMKTGGQMYGSYNQDIMTTDRDLVKAKLAKASSVFAVLKNGSRLTASEYANSRY